MTRVGRYDKGEKLSVGMTRVGRYDNKKIGRAPKMERAPASFFFSPS